MYRLSVTKLVTLLIGVTIVTLQMFNVKTFLENQNSQIQQDDDDDGEQKVDPFDMERYFKVCSVKRSMLHTTDFLRLASIITLVFKLQKSKVFNA